MPPLPDPDDRLLRAVRGAEPGDAGPGDAGPGDVRPGEAGADDELDADDLVDLTRLGTVARSLTEEDLALDEPPAAVWEGIAARVGLPSRAGAPGDAPPAAPAPDVPGAPDVPDLPAAAPASDVAEVPDTARDAEVTPLGPRHAARSSAPARRWGLVAAAAAVVVVLAGIVVVGTRDGDDTGEVVSSVQLDPLGEGEAVTAELVESDGELQLDIPLDDAGLPAPAGFFEVWLIDEQIDGMVSLGPARADGTYAVPPDVDVARFPIVDISVEPPDGVPTHSGVSVLRGTLA